jgi:fumarate reductase flavoprotein subunit
LTRRVVVVGGGLAGSAAACRAQELGGETTLIDAADDPTAGGNSVLATGGLHIGPRCDPEVDDPETISAAINRSTAGLARPALVEAYAQNARRALAWVVDAGAELLPRTPETEYPRLAPARDLNDFHAWHGGGTHRALAAVQARLRRLGGRVRPATRGVRLRFAPDGTGTVAAVQSESGEVFPADAVVFADGGFHADLNLMREHVTPKAERLFPRARPGARGDALRMAVSAGAGLAGTDRFYGHCLHQEAFENDRLWPWPGLDEVMTGGGIFVDPWGHRIVDEGLGGVAVANGVARAPDPSGWVVISDEVWRALEGREVAGHLASNPELERRGATIHRAESPRALGRLLNIDGDALAATLAAYNRAVGAGAGLTVPRTGTALSLTGPLLAMPLVPGVSHTVGGMVIDADARVLDVEGRPILGLFAAGAAAAGIFEGPRSGYVGGLMVALITGLLAGEGASHHDDGSVVARSSKGIQDLSQN